MKEKAEQESLAKQQAEQIKQQEQANAQSTTSNQQVNKVPQQTRPSTPQQSAPQQNQSNITQTEERYTLSKAPKYTKAQMNELVKYAINYGKSIGLTYLGEEANKDNSSWMFPPATDSAYKYDIKLEVEDSLNSVKKDNIKYFGIQLEDGTFNTPAGQGHWTIYVLMG